MVNGNRLCVYSLIKTVKLTNYHNNCVVQHKLHGEGVNEYTAVYWCAVNLHRCTHLSFYAWVTE